MTYVETVEQFGRQEQRLNAAKLTADLAEALGGAVIPREESHDTRNAKFAVDGLTVYVRGDWRDSKVSRVEVGVGMPDIEQVWGAGAVKWPSITVDSGRPLATVARDIKRRVIDAAAAPAATLRAKAAEHTERLASLQRHAEALREAFPWLEVKIESPRDAIAKLWGRGVYFSGRLSADGAVTFDRLQALDAATAGAVLAAIGKGAAPK